MILISTSFHGINSAIVPILSSSANVGFLQCHMERVIGYKRVRKNVITERPCEWDGYAKPNGLKDLEPKTQIRIVYRAIYKQCGPTTFNTMDSPVLPVRETPMWGINTDDARGKKRK